MLPSLITCPFGDKCKDTKCLKFHQTRMKCRYGEKCKTMDCTCDHQTPSNPSHQSLVQQKQHSTPGLFTTHKQQTMKTFPKSQSSGENTIDKLPKVIQIPCKFGDDCANTKCCFLHKKRKPCKNGPKCFTLSCTFDHESLGNPSRFSLKQQQAIKQRELNNSDLDGYSSDGSEESSCTIGENDYQLDLLSIADSDMSDIDSLLLDESFDALETNDFKLLQTHSPKPCTIKPSQLDSVIEKAEVNLLQKQMDLGMRVQKNVKDHIFKDPDTFRENKMALDAEAVQLKKQEEAFKLNIRKLKEMVPQYKDLALRAIERELKRAQSLFPFYAFREQIIETIQKHDVVVIVGQTGSGKSTQIPQYLLESGLFPKKIVCTQPRKVAASSLAKRISEEMCCVGSPLISAKVIGEKPLSPQDWSKNKLLFMTDRSLLNELLKKKMKNYSCVIIDEAHERTVFTDILLAELKQLSVERRKEGNPLKIIITSATIDEKLFSDYFGNCPIISVPGQLYPVKVHWEKTEDNYVSQAIRKVMQILNKRSTKKDQFMGDILVFLTNPEEIGTACSKLKKEITKRNRNLQGKTEEFEILPLHGKLTSEAQQQALNPIAGKTKIIFSSNIAETSVTINGVTTIIDSGRVKERMYDQNRNISLLKVNYISQSASRQRKGRAGRTQAGECYNLYEPSDFNQFQISQPAEIFRTHLGSVILQILQHTSKSLTLQDLTNYDLLEKPSAESIYIQLQKLESLGFIQVNTTKSNIVITEEGKIASQLFMEPSASRMIIEGIKRGISDDILKIAAVMTVSGIIFVRSTNEKEKDDAIFNKVASSKSEGDLYSLLVLFDEFSKRKTFNEKKQWCKSKMLNFTAFSLATSTCNELKRSIKPFLKDKTTTLKVVSVEGKKKDVLDCITAGFHSNFAYYNGKGKNGTIIYKLQELNMEACLHPSSVVLSEDVPPSYILFYELMRTDKLYVKNVTPVDLDTVCIFNRTINKASVAQSIKKYFERQIPVSYINILRARGGELLEELERKTGCLVEIDDASNKLTMEIAAKEEYEIKKSIDTVLETVHKRVTKHLYEFIPQGQNVRVLIGDGLDVRAILTKDEYIRLNFRTTSKQYEDEGDLNLLFGKFGRISELIIYPNITSSQKVEGYATFERCVDAQRAFDSLKDDTVIQVFPTSLNNEKLAMSDEVPNLEVKYFLTASKGTAFIEFSDNSAANEALQVMGSNFLGSSPKRNNKSVKDIVLFNLPKQYDEIIIKQHLKRLNIIPENVVVDREEYKGDVFNHLGVVMFRSLFTQFSGLDMVEIYPAENAKTRFIKVLVRYNQKESAEKALKTLNGTLFEGGTIHISFQIDRIVIPNDVFEEMKPIITTLMDDINRKYNCHVSYTKQELNQKNSKFETGNTGIFKFSHVTDLKEYEEARRRLNEVVKYTKIAYSFSQHNHLDKIKSKIKEEMKKDFKVFISFDSRTRSIKIYGERKQEAEVKIRERLRQIVVREIPLRSIKAIVGKDGSTYKQLKQEFKGEISLDLKQKRIYIQSTDTEYEALKQKIQNLENGSTDGSGEHECIICYSELDPCKQLSCKHPACHSCLALQIDGFDMESKHLECMECNQCIPFLDLLASYDSNISAFNKPCESILTKYLLSHGKEWMYCNKCNSLSKISEMGSNIPSYNCLRCEKTYCTKCNNNSHVGPCIDVDKLFEEYRKQYTKMCPKCLVPIEKNGGCNHVTCRACPNHFCWLCGFSADSGHLIYDHQSSCLGDNRYFPRN